MVKDLSLDPVAALISQHIDKLKNRKSQRELALKMGFKSVNMLSMIKMATPNCRWKKPDHR